ncbi:MAG: hypothetical protein PVJ60_09570 [Phycisphaerales bacterium]|jgi:hypothetical protein
MAKTLKTSPDNRICAFPGCKQVLSIYNHQTHCHVHREEIAEKHKFKNAYHHFSGNK